MDNLREFIDDAIKGGFFVENLRFNGGYINENTFSSRGDMSSSDLLINPDAWRAVAKTRGWFELACSQCCREATPSGYYYQCPEHGLLVEELYADRQWKLERSQFFSHLDAGLSIEQALSKLKYDTR